MQFSVVIPTHHRPRLLADAIHSVLQQWGVTYEVIVVSDGPSEVDRQVVRSFGSGRLLHVDHHGPRGGGAARNTGITQAHGEWVAFLDDDDLWLPGRLWRMFKLLPPEGSEIGMLYSGATYSRQGRDEGQFTPHARGKIPQSARQGNIVPSTSVMVVRKDVLEGLGGFDETLMSGQEYDLVQRIAVRWELNYHTLPDVVLRRGDWPRISTDPYRKGQGMKMLSMRTVV